MAPERAPAAARPWLLLLAGVAVALLVILAVLHETAASPPPTTPAARAHAIGERLACPICQGETVADSPSVLAQQMRGIIADQVAQGRSDAAIEQYFVDRYGTGILLAPPAQGFSLLAWALPLGLLVLGGGGVALAAVRWSRRGAADALPALTPEEQARYGALLAQRLAEAEAAEAVFGAAGDDAKAASVGVAASAQRVGAVDGAVQERPPADEEQGGDCGPPPNQRRLRSPGERLMRPQSPPSLAADRSRRPTPPIVSGPTPDVGDETPDEFGQPESDATPHQEARSSAC